MTEPKTRPSRRVPFRDIAVAAALALAMGLMLTTAPFPFHRVARAIAFPYQLDAEEGFMLNQALRLSQGENLYGDIASPPYLVDNYPPLYPALWSLFVDTKNVSLGPGRAIGAIAAAATALLVAALILWHALASRPSAPSRLSLRLLEAVPLAIAAPLLFLTSRAWIRWNPYARVDVLAGALGLGGLAAFAIVARREKAPVLRTTAAMLFALAFLTKQTALAAPAACALWLLLRDWRAGLRFIAALAAALLMPFLILIVATEGRYWLHLVTYNRNVMHWNELAGWFQMGWALYAPLIGTVALAGIGILATRRGNQSETGVPVSLVAIYLTINGLSLLTLAKSGAAENYLLEPLTALALALGIGIAELIRRSDSRIATSILAACLALLLWHAARFSHASPPWVSRSIAFALYQSAPRPAFSALSAGDRVVRRIRERDGDALCEDPVYTLMAERRVPFQHFIMTQLASEGKWDEAPFVKQLQDGAFALIMAHQDLQDQSQFFNRHTPAMRRAIASRYRLIERIDRTPPLQPIFLYEPRKEAQP